MASPIHNPGTPYIGQIPGGVQAIHVSGTAEHHHTGFLISLQNGPSIDPRNDCPFVFNPRFNENAVIRNSLNHGSWQTEERHGGFPFHKGHRFEVTIQISDHHYKVLVNNRHFCDYNHRMPKHMCTYLTVEQGIKIHQIRFEHGYPGGAGYPGPTGYPGPAGPVYNPPVPFVHNMPGGLYPNKMIYISGIPHPNPSRISIYFECGHGGDVAFVFDIRFNFGSDRNVLVRNNKVGGQWKNEERHASHFPFARDAFFELLVLVDYNCYKVAVNNQHLLEFFHRVQQLQRVDTLRIDGDIRLTQVRFQ